MRRIVMLLTVIVLTLAARHVLSDISRTIDVSFTVDSTVCPAQFTDTSCCTITSWLWDFGDGNTSILPSPQHSYASPGNYSVWLTATSASGIDSTCQSVTISAKPSFSADPGPCSVPFTNTTTAFCTVTSWLWDFGDGNTSMGVEPTHSYSSPGVYTVCLTASGQPGTDSTCQSVTVPSPSVDFAADTNTCPIQFTGTHDNFCTVTSHFWDFGDGNTSTQLSPTHTYASTGSYHVCLTNFGQPYADSTCHTVNNDGCLPYNAAVSDPARPSQYALVPWPQMHPLSMSATVSNLGGNTLSTVVATATVEQNGGAVLNSEALPVGSMGAGISTTAAFTSFTPVTTGEVNVSYTVGHATSDDVPANDEVTVFAFDVTDEWLSRSDGLVSGSLNFGGGAGAELSTTVTIRQPTNLAAVWASFATMQTGDTIVARVRAIEGGAPGTLIAESLPFSAPFGGNQSVYFTFAGPLFLSPGDYAIGVTESVLASSSLHYSDDLFQRDTQWFDVPGSPYGPWATIEQTGLSKSYLIRAQLLQVPADHIFVDGFEPGSAVLWSSSVP